jgi:type I restriction enzyme S subunit
MDAETAALFPARFTEWRNRYLPYGWRLGCVSELGDVICGKTPATANKANYGAEIPFITIPDMHGKVFVLSAARSLSTQGAVSQANKTVPPRSVCVSCIATPGLVAMTTEASQTNQQINTVIPRDDQAAFYAFFCLRDLGDDIRARGSGGSVYHNLNKGQFSALEIALPSDEVVSRFGQAVAPAFDLLLLNDRQTLTLMALRDTLLPKLLSGEFRIRDAEKMVEANV